MILLYDDQIIGTCLFEFRDGRLTHRKLEVGPDRVLLHLPTLEGQL